MDAHFIDAMPYNGKKTQFKAGEGDKVWKGRRFTRECWAQGLNWN